MAEVSLAHRKPKRDGAAHLFVPMGCEASGCADHANSFSSSLSFPFLSLSFPFPSYMFLFPFLAFPFLFPPFFPFREHDSPASTPGVTKCCARQQNTRLVLALLRLVLGALLPAQLPIPYSYLSLTVTQSDSYLSLPYPWRAIFRHPEVRTETSLHYRYAYNRMRYVI